MRRSVKALAVRSALPRRTRRQAISEGTGAAERLRKRMRAAVRWPCAGCGIRFLASALDVDHIKPLFKGGEDVDENVQALCRYVCHWNKTRDDMGYTNAPF